MQHLERASLPVEQPLRIPNVDEEARFAALEDTGGGILRLQGEEGRVSDGEEFLDDEDWCLTSPHYSAYLHAGSFSVGQTHATLLAKMQRTVTGFTPVPENTCYRLWNCRTHEVEHVSYRLFEHLRPTLIQRVVPPAPTLH